MTIGTKSLLFGAHQFILHPLFVLVAWWKLYGRPKWWELLAIVVHDWGYWGCPNMDGREGKEHPRRGAELAARIVLRLVPDPDLELSTKVLRLCCGHSRSYAKKIRATPSRLCWADKLGVVLEPWWLYLPRVILSGELNEYRWNAAIYHSETGRGVRLDKTHRTWFKWLQDLNVKRVLTARGVPVKAFQ